MNLVASSLRRPITVVVLVIAVLLGAGLAVKQMARDIFPTLGIPTIYVAQPYGGMDPAQMEGYLTYYYEYHFLYITGIEHVESQSIQGATLLKLQFHPGTDMSQAMSETVAYVNRARAFMPPGTVPPFVMRFDAGSVPIGDLVFSSATRTVGEMQDLALNRVRPLFATLPGVSAPPPFGGSARSIVISVKPERLRAYNMSPDEVVSAITSANLISPSGNMPIGGRYPMVPLNSVVKNIKDLENVPVRTGVYPTVFVRDIGTIADGSDIVTSYALVNGRRRVYVPVTKRADASTLSVVSLVKQNLEKFQSVLPQDVKVSYEFDQSPYVTRAIGGLTLEGALGALLTGLMILLFLRDWRSAFIVVINIPLSLMAAVLALWITKQTINIMTLGGLALAVGILVDEATVSIENIHVHLLRGKSLGRAALDATNETTGPRLLAMLCILAMFTPALFMVGAARAMFVPLSLAVGFSMVASYLLSSTLVPILSVWVLRGHEQAVEGRKARESAFARFQRAYGGLAHRAVRWRWLVTAVYLVATGVTIGLLGRGLGTEIFPQVEAGQLQVRLRAPAGTQIDGTEALALRALDLIKQEAGSQNVQITLGFIGVHGASYPINLIYLWTGGPEEGVLQVQLNKGAPIQIDELKERLRHKFAEQMPEVSFSFEPSDIVSRVMSLGSPTPIEVAVSGPNLAASQTFAQSIKDRLQRLGDLRDVQFGQSLDYPTVDVTVDRQKAGLMGVKMADVSRSLAPATWSSRFVVPNYWADPNSGVSYQVQVQVPQARLDSLEEARNIPILNRDGQGILLRNVAKVTAGTTVGQYQRYNMQRLITVTANIAGSDLGTVARQVKAVVNDLGPPPSGANVAVRGQIVPLQQMLDGLRTGLLLAVVVIFLLLAANFQSLKLSLVVVATTPAVIAGVVIMLWLTRTTLNIQSFMGTIMAIGVAMANAILLVTFAERARAGQVSRVHTPGDAKETDGRTPALSAADAAVEGARSRLRPILMTSLAMVAGMVPMALGLGEGGEQTAPLGRAVIGGLALATVATLLVLPAAFALVQGRAHRRSASLHPDDSSTPARNAALFIAALYVVVVLCGCEPSSSKAPPTPPAPVAVQTVLPKRGEISRSITLPSFRILACQEATLYAKVSGYLKTLSVDKGDSVKQGQLLAEIEVPELLADEVQYKAETAVSRTNYERMAEARQKAPDLVVPQTVDDLRGQWEIAQAKLQRTQTLLQFARIVAPFDGTITARFVDPGAFIPAATSGSTPQRAALVTLMDYSRVRVQVFVPEAEVLFVKNGLPVQVTLEELPGRSFPGTVTRFAHALDEATKTMLTEIELPNPRGELRPGAYASVRLEVERKPDALLIPIQALAVEKAGTFVYAAIDHKAVKAPVHIGFNDGVHVEVIDLQPDQPVILLGKLSLTNGQPINPVEAK